MAIDFGESRLAQTFFHFTTWCRCFSFSFQDISCVVNWFCHTMPLVRHATDIKLDQLFSFHFLWRYVCHQALDKETKKLHNVIDYLLKFIIIFAFSWELAVSLNLILDSFIKIQNIYKIKLTCQFKPVHFFRAKSQKFN